MPTNEERREAACMVRSASDQSPRMWQQIRGMLGMPKDWGIPQIREYLASLIEPEPERTCRLVPMPWNGAPPYRRSNVVLDGMTEGCSECGYPFGTASNGRPNYCPNCGARAIDGVLG